MANLIYKGLKANLPAERNATSFYLCTDTRELFFGSDLYTEAVRFYDGTKPTAPAQGVLYIDTVSGAGDVWNGSTWKSVFTNIVTKTVVTSITDSAADSEIATAKATKAYVDAKTEGIASDEELTALKTRVTTAEGDIDAIEEEIGTVPTGKTVVQLIEDSKYDDSALKTRVSKNETDIATLNGDENTAGSVKKQVADAVAKIVADAPEAYDTLKEISDWISSHSSDASAMNSQINTNKSDIAALKALVGELPEGAEASTIVAYIQEVVDGLAIGDYAKAADLTAAVARIATLEGKAHEHSNKTVLDGITSAKVTAWDAAEKNAKDYADGLNTAMDTRVKAVEEAVTVGTF